MIFIGFISIKIDFIFVNDRNRFQRMESVSGDILQQICLQIEDSSSIFHFVQVNKRIYLSINVEQIWRLYFKLISTDYGSKYYKPEKVFQNPKENYRSTFHNLRTELKQCVIVSSYEIPDFYTTTEWDYIFMYKDRYLCNQTVKQFEPHRTLESSMWMLYEYDLYNPQHRDYGSENLNELVYEYICDHLRYSKDLIYAKDGLNVSWIAMTITNIYLKKACYHGFDSKSIDLYLKRVSAEHSEGIVRSYNLSTAKNSAGL